jgi:hypothetical protein
MDAVLALDGGQDESAGLCELLEIVDEWLGDSHGASDAEARLSCSANVPSPPLVYLESVVAAAESTTAALPGAATPSGLMQEGNGGDTPWITAKHVPVSGSKRPRERNTAVDMLRRLKKRAEHSLLRVEVRDLEFQLAALRRSRCSGLNTDRARGHHLPSLPSSGDDTPGEEVCTDKQHQGVQVNHQLRDRVVKNDVLLRSICNALRCSAIVRSAGAFTPVCQLTVLCCWHRAMTRKARVAPRPSTIAAPTRAEARCRLLKRFFTRISTMFSGNFRP